VHKTVAPMITMHDDAPLSEFRQALSSLALFILPLAIMPRLTFAICGSPFQRGRDSGEIK
jgi:hypothetical protein